MFEMSRTVIDDFFAAKAAREAERPTGTLTTAIERQVLGRIARNIAERLDRKMATLRSALTFDWQAGQVDEFARAMDEERALAVVCRLLALKGSSAHIDAKQKVELEAIGFGPALIEHMTASLREHARNEQYRTWNVGPTYEQIVGLLVEAGVEPSDTATARLRRNGLLLMSEILDDVERRYQRSSTVVSAAYADLLSETDAVGTGLNSDRCEDASMSVETSKPEPGLISRSSPMTNARTPVPIVGSVAAPGPAPSFLELTERLVATRLSGRKPDWEIKTANQHRAAAKLLVKQVGTDDPRLIKQAHIGFYFDLLAKLPKHYGKSSKDEQRSLDEILARVEDLDEHEIGLEAGTVNRHQSQLGNLLEHMRGYGYDCGEAFASFRRRDTDADSKRRPFSKQDGLDLFSSSVYRGSAAPNKRLSPGNVIIQDALYWVPLIGWYGLLRLGEITGLLISDVDIDAPAFQIANNAIRRIKNAQSKRRIPMHPELLRLGMLDYVEALKVRGHKLLFPELQERGQNTPLSAFFYKDFKPMLDAALPHASQQRITFHSTRKTGNTAMIVGKVLDVTRLKILGHTPPGVNGKHYTAQLPDGAVLEALGHLSIVTGLVEPRALRLSPLLDQGTEITSCVA